MKIKHIVSLGALVALTGASCQGAAHNRFNPGEDFFYDLPDDYRASMTEFLDPKSLGRWAITSRRSANDFRDIMSRPAYKLLKTLLARRNGNLQEAFFDAVRNDDPNATSVINYLIWNGVDINVPNDRDKKDNTALMSAASDGREALVNLLINANANLNAGNDSGKTALMLAAENGHKGVVDQLINAGAKLNKHNLKFDTALSLARQNGHEEIVDRLMQANTKNESVRDMDEEGGFPSLRDMDEGGFPSVRDMDEGGFPNISF